MKTNKLTYLLALGLVLTLAVTGCKKRPGSLQQIPGRAGVPNDPSMNNLPPGQNDGSIPTGPIIDLSNYIEDASALAANAVHFDYDSAVVKKSDKVNVEAAVAVLRLDAAAKLRVEGHCDERGTEEYNRALGERRALAIREAMAKLGIDPERIVTLSFGEDKPAAPGHDESAWKQNRRGEFIVLHPK